MAQLRSDLKSWEAYSHELLNVAERKRRYIFPTSIGWSCIICNDEIHSCPVFQCQKGHLACYSCSQSGKKYTKCSNAAVSRIRNLAVEEMLEAMLMTCRNAEFGCKETVDFTDQKECTEHENRCEYAPIVCPIPGCLLAGVKNGLNGHLLTKHKTSTVVDMPLKDFELENFTSTLVVLRDPKSGAFYILHQESTTLGDTFRVTSESCKKSYDLKVSIGEDAAKYSFTGTCTSSSQKGYMLLIPKQAGKEYVRKRCTIELINGGEVPLHYKRCKTEMVDEDEDEVPLTTLIRSDHPKC